MKIQESGIEASLGHGLLICSHSELMYTFGTPCLEDRYRRELTSFDTNPQAKTSPEGVMWLLAPSLPCFSALFDRCRLLEDVTSESLQQTPSMTYPGVEAGSAAFHANSHGRIRHVKILKPSLDGVCHNPQATSALFE
jgi:hypothetical protein